MYNIEEINGATIAHVVRMSFELPYLDWCRFERSALYNQLAKYLEELKNQDTLSEKQDKKVEENVAKLFFSREEVSEIVRRRLNKDRKNRGDENEQDRP